MTSLVTYMTYSLDRNNQVILIKKPKKIYLNKSPFEALKTLMHNYNILRYKGLELDHDSLVSVISSNNVKSSIFLSVDNIANNKNVPRIKHYSNIPKNHSKNCIADYDILKSFIRRYLFITEETASIHPIKQNPFQKLMNILKYNFDVYILNNYSNKAQVRSMNGYNNTHKSNIVNYLETREKEFQKNPEDRKMIRDDLEKKIEIMIEYGIAAFNPDYLKPNDPDFSLNNLKNMSNVVRFNLEKHEVLRLTKIYSGKPVEVLIREQNKKEYKIVQGKISRIDDANFYLGANCIEFASPTEGVVEIISKNDNNSIYRNDKAELVYSNSKRRLSKKERSIITLEGKFS